MPRRTRMVMFGVLFWAALLALAILLSNRGNCPLTQDAEGLCEEHSMVYTASQAQVATPSEGNDNSDSATPFFESAKNRFRFMNFAGFFIVVIAILLFYDRPWQKIAKARKPRMENDTDYIEDE